MSGESPLVSSSLNNGSSNGKMKRKRNRIPLSCTICRKRKVKCDKTRPHCDQCVKTGVAHLCHYMEQSWAEEAEKEISKETELKQLRDRVKSLEESLSKVHSVCSNTPDSNILVLDNGNEISGDDSKFLSGNSKYSNDELDLTRQFDMLHLKNNGTIHLGATHWLAIMKGDPYLKLLWGHIFSMREKLAEWYSQRRKVPHAKGMTKPGMPSGSRCPVDHSSMGFPPPKRDDSPSPLQQMPSKCPVDHATMKKCPVDHTAMSKCPVDHTAISKCPVSHGSSIKEEHDIPRPPSLPSFQNLTSKCPVIHQPSAKDFQIPRPPLQSYKVATKPITHEQVLARVTELLPPKRIICSFMEKFFKQIYPVIPIIDEQNFKNHMNHILSLRTFTGEGDTVQKLRTTKLADYCNLGILIIILRLTWLSLPSNACEVDLGSQCSAFLMPQLNTASVTQAKEESLLIKYETPVEALELIREHLIKFDQISSISNCNVNLTTVQFAIFYKLYLMCWANDTPSANNSPDACVPGTINDGGGQDNETHQVLLSSITQMAFSCGLHRDPDNFPQLNAVSHGQPENSATAANNNTSSADGPSAKASKDAQASTERFKHTWRKTWYYIVSLDVQQSLSLGTPRLLRNLRDFSDTKLPSASKIDYVRDIKELVIVKNTTLFFQIDLCIVSVLNHILNVSLAKNVRKFELDSLIVSLSDLTHGKRNICDVVTGLVNKGLLFTTEGVVDQNTDEVYGLPSLEEILSQHSSSSADDVDKKLDLAHESATRALFFSKHLTLRMLLYLLNYILFTHYEPMATEDPGTAVIAKEYAQETLNYAMDGYRNCMLFFNNLKTAGTMSSMFSYMEVVLAPQCLDIGRRALQFIFCLVLRAKCGPLTGMGEGTINNANSCSSSSEDERETSASKKEDSAELTDDVARDISLDTGEALAETLMNRMALFHKMTKQVCVKYHYAARMMRSTGFFLALLKHPNAKSKGDQKNGSQPGRKPPFSNFLRNVPSLILSADGEQLKRCPVYQDAIGFAGPRTMSNNNNQFVFPPGHGRFGAQLPPLRSYKPITYNSSNVRRTAETEENDQKRRRLNSDPAESVKLADHISAPLPPLQPVSSPAMTLNGMVSGIGEPLPPLDRIAGQFTPLPMENVPVTNPANAGSPSLTRDVNLGGMTTFTSPASEVSSAANYTPAFEDFLLQNSNFNGIMINPSSIVEAVGFHNFDSSDIPIGSEGVDFLPIDNAAIDGLSELTRTEFPAWE